MATSTLIVYEPLSRFGDSAEYWQDYSSFYERYWGGPTSPFGIWFGNEYENFRKALSEHMGLADEEIRDCFFLKKGEEYFIAPLKDSINLFSFENSIPAEWFVLFDRSEKKNFYTHWGFNTIHYDTSLEKASERAKIVLNVIRDTLELKTDIQFKGYLEYLAEGIENIYGWIESFSSGGFVVLNYGDICTYIHLLTLQNEKSVEEIQNFFDFLEKKNYDEADSLLRVFIQKWEDIKLKCEGETDSEVFQ